MDLQRRLRRRVRARRGHRDDLSPGPKRPQNMSNRSWCEVSVRVERLSVHCVQFPSLQPTVRLTRTNVKQGHGRVVSSSHCGKVATPPQGQQNPSEQSQSPEEATSSTEPGPKPRLNPEPRLYPGPKPQLKPDLEHTVVLLDSEWRTFYLDPEPNLIIQLNHEPATKSESGLTLPIDQKGPGLRFAPEFGPELKLDPDLDSEILIEVDQTTFPEPGLDQKPGIDLKPGLDLDLLTLSEPGLGHGLEEDLVLDGSLSKLHLCFQDSKTDACQNRFKNLFKNQDFLESEENFPNIKIEVEDIVEDSPDECADVSSDVSSDISAGLRFGDQSDSDNRTDETIDHGRDLGFKVDWTEDQDRGNALKVHRIQVQDSQIDGAGKDEHIKEFKVDQADGGGSDDCGGLPKADDSVEQAVEVDCSGGESLKVDWPEDRDRAEVLKVDWEDFCAVCSNGGELLCCEHCPKVYHLSCHVPPLLSVPRGDWVCSLCRPDQDGNRDLDSAWFRGSPVPYALCAQDQRRCERLTLLLLTHPLSAPFHLPVSPEIRHYYQIVRRPVDLSSVQRKLDSRNTLRYYSPEQFVDDVLLMFHNCANFNYPDSEVAEAGLKLKTFFLLKLKEVFPERTFPSTNQRADRKCRLKWSQKRRNKFCNFYFK